MKNTKLVKLMQIDLDSGKSLQNIFKKYQDEDITEKKLAYLVSTLKDKCLIKKHKIANKTLLVFMFIITTVMVMLAYSAAIKLTSGTAIYWLSMMIMVVMAIIPLLFLYGFLRNNYQTYLAYIIFAMIQLPKSFASISSGNTFDEIVCITSLLLIILVLYLKYQLFPYMGLLGPKKDVANQYLVVKSS